MSLIVDEHRQYLSDDIRVSAFRRAIREVVRPGATVLDLASGTGILGLLACEAGASRVYAIEVTGMVEVARAVAQASGYGDRMIVLLGMSTEVQLPERVDVIVCDQIGRFGIEAGLISHLTDARDRFLKPNGTLMPARLDLFLAPVEADEQFKDVEFWAGRPAGFDFGPARRWAANTGYPLTVPRESLLSAPARVASLDLATIAPDSFRVGSEMVVTRRGTLHGLAAWFSAQLSPSVVMSNAPTADERIGRRNAFFPIDRAVSVVPGDIVRAGMHVNPAVPMVSWTVDVRRGPASLGTFRHSTLSGMLVSREDLHRMDPRYVPHLTERGKARLTLLELCDGRRTLAEVEREVYERHPGLFASMQEAGAFVAEVVTIYTS